MNKNYIIIGVIAVLVIWGISSFNGLVGKDEKVTASWSQVENVYQRKVDLIGNLVSTVKNYADFEKDVLIKVTEARANASSMKIDPANLTEDNIAKFEAAQGQLNGALSRLLVTVEKYPDLKANEGYIKLQDELTGSENRISTERRNFTTVVQEYNTSRRSFPTNLLAGIFGFKTKANFQADPEAKGGKVDVDKLFNK